METALMPPRIQAVAGLATARRALEDAHFVEYPDGWFYPAAGPDKALVRVSVGHGDYQLWRRRKLTTGWMPIVVDDIELFSRDAFDTWRQTFPLSC